MDQTQPKRAGTRPLTRADWATYGRAGLRDTAGVLRRPYFWGLLAVGIFLTTLAGPFGTFADLAFVPRLVYWTLGILPVAVLVTTLSFIAYNASRALGRPWPLGALLAALVAIPPHLLLVHGLDGLFLAQGSQGLWALLPHTALPVLVMTMLVNAVVIRILSLSEALKAPTPAAPVPAAEIAPLIEPTLLFQRVPAHLGRDVVCLRAQDHYLEVVTTIGSALVLMRLSDAERDLAGLRGMRVHRSWWVALDHVSAFSQAEGGGVNLTTTTGHTVPVARAQRAALRAALQEDERRAAE